jgi:KipI family sensor histidine kinase inhibitor
VRLLPAGDRAILVELDDPAARHRLATALAADPIPDVLEVVPAHRTVLVRATPGATLQRIADRLRAFGDPEPAPPGRTGPADLLTIPVTYDGPDLADVAHHLGVDVAEVVARHTNQLWTVEFGGFAPGFGYLLGDEGGLDTPRRSSPRTRVPAGSVGLAGPYAGVYPHASSGGWQIVGTTTVPMWDAERDPPALLTPGRRVRFVEAAR